MGHEENKSAVAEAIGHFNDSNGRRVYLEIHDSSVTAHGLGSADPVDFEGVTQFYETLWSAFPGVEATIEEMIAEGDPVSFRVTVRGTHRGEFMGVAPSGNQVTFGVQNIYRFRDSKVVERWSNPDLFGLMVQIGAIPAPPSISGEFRRGPAGRNIEEES
jgi:predicted ester cyclase